MDAFNGLTVFDIIAGSASILSLIIGLLARRKANQVEHQYSSISNSINEVDNRVKTIEVRDVNQSGINTTANIG